MTSSYYPAAPYDRLVTAITLYLWIGLIALTAFFYYLFLFSSLDSLILGITIVSIITALTAGILAIPFLFSPRGYRLTSTELIIQRPVRNIAIPYNQIIEINQLNWIWKGIRLAGSGGLYGYLGLFYLSGVGKVWIYVTNKNKMILVKCINDKQYAISPNSIDFLTEVQDKLAIK
jgi:hypothetical protein